MKAADHVFALVDGSPASVELSGKTYSSDQRLSTFFASVDHMRQVLWHDRSLSDYLASPPGRDADRIETLLVTQRMERNVLGMKLTGYHSA